MNASSKESKRSAQKVRCPKAKPLGNERKASHLARRFPLPFRLYSGWSETTVRAGKPAIVLYLLHGGGVADRCRKRFRHSG